MRIDGLFLLVVALPLAATWIAFALTGPEDRRRSARPYRITAAEWRWASWRGALVAAGAFVVLVALALVGSR